jgi:16S rRNA (uracil1498-N3)-methyltransferase
VRGGLTSAIRLFVTDPLAEGAALSLAAGQAHYLGTVMRREAGQSVLVFNGRDGEWRARITALGRGRAALSVEAMTRPQPRPPDLWLLAPVLKRDTLAWMVEKATELGVSRILLTTSARSAVPRANAERLAATAVEAAEQCGRLDVPALEPAVPLAARLAAWPAGRHLLVGDATGTAPAAAAVIAASGPGAWGAAVGPEGGFTPGELDAFGKLPFCRRASLGPRTLRAETAAVAAVALLQALAGDWRDHHLP